MDWNEAIAKTAAYLAAKSVDDARTVGELLAARLLRVKRGWLAPHLAKIVSERELDALRRAMVRLANGEPVQYVLGEWDFRTLTLKCDRRALIPRPETEGLVSIVLDFLRQLPRAPLVVDVGTGTGAIILSLAKEYEGRACFLGTDLSEEAIALARENAALTGLENKVKLAVADGLEDFSEPETIDVIVSNPPYVESAVVDTLAPNVRDFEPRMALDGGVKGLDFYERYLGDAINLLKPGGGVFFEIGSNQGLALREMLLDYGFDKVEIRRDLAGLDRYALGTLK